MHFILPCIPFDVANKYFYNVFLLFLAGLSAVLRGVVSVESSVEAGEPLDASAAISITEEQTHGHRRPLVAGGGAAGFKQSGSTV